MKITATVVKYLFTVILLILINFPSLTQKRLTIFYNEEWEITSKTSDKYFRTAIIDTTEFFFIGPVRDFLSNGTLVMTGQYRVGLKQDTFVHYFPNKQIERIGKFDQGEMTGIWKYYHSNGQLKYEVQFDNFDFRVLNSFDSLGKQQIKNGSGDWSVRNEKGNIFCKGSFKKGVRHGKWKYYENEKFIHEINFMNGYPASNNQKIINEDLYLFVMVEKHSLFFLRYSQTEQLKFSGPDVRKEYPILAKAKEESNYPVLFTFVESMPECQNKEGVYDFINKKLKALSFEKKISGNQKFSFIISPQGTIDKIYHTSSLGEEYNKAIADVLESPDLKWIPGFQWGIAVPVILDGAYYFDNNPGMPSQADSVFKTVEVMPEFTGGKQALFKFLAQNLRYPEEASRKGEQGVVYTSFVVNSNGKISEIEIQQGVSPSIDREALRIIRSMPDWIPGTIDGKPVHVRYSLPLRFIVNH